jgi:hypothetical protein
MRVLGTLVVGLLAFGAPALAQDAEEAAPEFLLGDVGVRVDLPRGWKMTRWSDWDFKAETADPLLLQAWSSEVQSDPSQLDAEVWNQGYLDKLEEMGAASDGIKLEKAEVVTIQDTPMALLDYSFALKSGTPAVLRGGTVSVEGQMFHLAIVAIKRHTKKVDQTRADLLDRLDIQSPAADVVWAPKLSGADGGFEHTLPDNWREPLQLENAQVNTQIGAMGMEVTDSCWLAMRPAGLAEPDALAACQQGLQLGVVDGYSFEGIDAQLKTKFFGEKAKIGPAKQIDLDDRVGFLYDLSDKGLAVGVVPYNNGVVSIRAKGTPGDVSLAEAVEATMRASSYSGTHPAGIGDMVSYYLSYRPLHPVVLAPAALLLLLLGGAAMGLMMLLGGRKNKYEDLAED